MTEEGIVGRKKGKITYVELRKTAQCDSCKACSFGKSQRILMPSVALVECEVGDKVRIELPAKKILLSPVLLYAIPLLFMMIGAYIGNQISDVVSMILAFSFLIIAEVFCAIIDKQLIKKHPKYIATIVARVEEKTEEEKSKAEE